MKNAFLIILISLAGAEFGVAQENVPLLDSIVQYFYVDGNDSTPSWKWEYQHNTEGLETSHGIFTWNYKHWNLFEKQQNIFNEKGDTIQKLEHHTQEHGLGFPYVKHEWEYDTNGNLLYLYKYHKFEDQENWIPNTRKEFKNDFTGQLIQELEYRWSNGHSDWAPAYLYTYYFNSFGIETEKIKDYWDSNSQSWGFSEKFETRYTAEGIKISEYIYSWQSDMNDWVKNPYFWTEYDSLGRISKQLKSNLGSSQLAEYFYDELGNATIYVSNSPPWIGNYIPHYKFIKTFNSENEIITEERYRKIDGLWSPEAKSENVFNENGIITETKLYKGDPETLDWYISGIKHYFYRIGSSGIDKKETEGITIFPNPTSGIINISGLIQPAEVKIYSVQRQLLKTEKQVINYIDISDLPCGVYLLNISTGNEVLKRTIVKK